MRPAGLRRFDEGALPPAMPDWSPVRIFGGYGAWGDKPAAANPAPMRRVLRLRRPLQCPRPGPCGGVVEQIADRGPQEFLGSARLLVLGGVNV